MFPKPEFLKIPHLELILPLVIIILGVVFMIYKTEQHLAQIISKEKNN
jgi:preprotein translocase subunit YajC